MLDLIKKKRSEIDKKGILNKSDLENLVIYGHLLLTIIENKLIEIENKNLKQQYNIK